jgi:hypothetical protein
VSVAVYYYNQFDDSMPADLPRDLRLSVFESDPITGAPTAEIFSDVFADTRGPFALGNPQKFLEIDLSEFDIGSLPEAIVVAVSNAGDDDNYVVSGLANYAAENVSFLTRDGAVWERLWDLTLSGTPVVPLESMMTAMRAHFTIVPKTVATDEPGEVPLELSLDQNYPNPFNPTTAVRFALPQATDVDLAVYDILGRRVATLLSGRQPAGSHEIVVDGSSWASGMYVYSLRTESRTLTRNMLMLK